MSALVLPAKENKKQPRWLFLILCCVFCGLYFVRDILGIGISYYIIYAVAAFTILSVRQEEAIAFFLALSSFTGAGLNGVFCTMLFGCVLLRFYHSLKTIKLYSLLLLLMCLIEGIHYLFASQISIGAMVTYIMVLLALLVVQQYPSEKLDKNLIVNTFIAFSLFFVLMTLIQMLISFGSLDALLQNGFRTEEYKEMREEDGLTANQNYITSLCSLNMCLCTLMLSKKYPKIPYILAILIFVVSGLLTVSKMFMAVVVAFVAYVIITTTRQKITRGLGVIALLGIAGVWLFHVFGDTLIKMVVERFEEEELTSGRVKIITDLLMYMNENPLTYVFGTGVLQVHYVGRAAIHSSFFEVLGGWGIVGLLLVTTYIIMLVREAKNNMERQFCKINGFNYLPLLMLLGYSLIGMLFGSSFAIARIMVCIYALYIKEKEEHVIQYHDTGV